jgi:hypothetical protein
MLVFLFAGRTEIHPTGITDGIGYMVLTDATDHRVNHYPPYSGKFLDARG